MLGGFGFLSYLDYRPKYDINKCVRYKSSKSTCSYCYDRCQYKAIKFHGRGISIKDSCARCGLCISSCPTNALTDGGRSFYGSRGKVLVLCNRIEGDFKDPKIRLECLQYFTPKILLDIHRKGVRKLLINRELCSDCKYHQDLEANIKEVNEILSLAGRPLMALEEIDLKDIDVYFEEISHNRKQKEVARRGFFKEIAKEIFSVGYEIAPPTVKEEGWKKTNTILNEFAKDLDYNIGIYDLSVDNEKCINCNACVNLCPEKVMEIKDNVLNYRSNRCIGCTLCVDICPTKALTLNRTSHKSYLKKYDKISKKCSLCERTYDSFIEQQDLCPKCISKEYFRKK